jgi:hypothetical protein
MAGVAPTSFWTCDLRLVRRFSWQRRDNLPFNRRELRPLEHDPAGAVKYQ